MGNKGASSKRDPGPGVSNPYQALLTSMMDGFILADEHGHILEANFTYQELSGFTLKELQKKNIRDLDIRMAEPDIGKERAKVLAQGNARFETIHRAKSGNDIVVDVSVVTIQERGKLLFGSLVKDKTPELEAKSVAEISTELYRNIFDHATVGIGIANSNGELISWNRELLEMSGFSDEEVRQIGRVSDFYYDSGDRDRLLELLKLKAKVEREVIRFKHKEKEFFTARLDLRPINVSNERQIMAVIEDISATIEQEQALEKSEKLYRTLVNTSPDAVMATNNEGEFVLASPTALKIFGYKSEKELLGKTSLITLHQDDHERAMQNHALLTEFGQLEKVIYKFTRKDGSTFMGEFSAAVIEPSNGEGSIYMATIRDISDRILVTDTLQQQLNELEILHKVGVIGASALDEDNYLSEIVDVIGESLYPDHLGFLFLDQSGKYLTPHASYRGLEKKFLSGQIPLENTISGKVFTSGEPALVSDVRKAKDFMVSTSGIRSELCVPIRVNGASIGIFNAESKKLDFFTEQDLQLLSTIANQVESTLERLHLFNAERQQRDLAEALQRTTTSLTGIIEYERILESILDSVGSIVPHHAADIMVTENGDTKVVHTRGYSKRAEGFLREFEKEAGSTTFIEQVLKKGKSILLADTYEEPNWVIFEDTAWIRSYISTPLRMRGEIIGILNLSSSEANFFNETSLENLEAFANQTSVAINNAMLFSELEQSNLELSKAYDSTLEGWSQALDLRDHETEGHSQRVTEMVVELATSFEIPDQAIVNIRRGSLLHDIGKVGIPDAILNKPDKLDEAEWTEMKRHPEYAFQILRDIDFLKEAADIPCYHHERWDGSGYPEGLKKDEIPISARLFAIIDVWDALRSDRPYRKAWSKEKALNHIAAESGKHFDPQIVKAFFATFASNWKSSKRKNGKPKAKSKKPKPASKAKEKSPS